MLQAVLEHSLLKPRPGVKTLAEALWLQLQFVLQRLAPEHSHKDPIHKLKPTSHSARCAHAMAKDQGTGARARDKGPKDKKTKGQRDQKDQIIKNVKTKIQKSNLSKK